MPLTPSKKRIAITSEMFFTLIIIQAEHIEIGAIHSRSNKNKNNVSPSKTRTIILGEFMIEKYAINKYSAKKTCNIKAFAVSVRRIIKAKFLKLQQSKA